MATPASRRVVGHEEHEDADSIDRLVTAFAVFTGRELAAACRAALRSMVEAVVHEESTLKLESNASHVDVIRLAETLYKYLEDAHAKELVMMLNEAGLDSETLDAWAERKAAEERRRR